MNPEDRMRELGSRDTATPSEAEWLEFRARGRRSVRNRRIAGAVGGAALVLAIVAGAIVLTGNNGAPDRVDVASSPTPSDNPSPETSPTRDPEPPADAEYLQQWFVADGKLSLAWASFQDTTEPEDALQGLLTVPGPLAESGVSTAFPSDTEILDVEITDDIAHVTFGGSFPDETDVQEELVYAQTVYTLTQFPEIKKVAVGWDSGESGGVARMPVTRERYHELLPQIVVEGPRPGETFAGTEFVLSGIANVFEANVSWRLLDENRNTVQEGFTTAACGTGCWGPFLERITLKGEAAKEKYLILEVFESSAEDGSPLHVVEIPLNFARND